MARFVVQQHTTAKEVHFDLMLEQGAKLLTWRIAEPPGGPQHGAARIGDHRIDYLTYEGLISDGRGSVRIWDRGELEIEKTAEGQIIFRLHGEIMSGRFSLLCEGNAWTLSKLEP